MLRKLSEPVLLRKEGRGVFHAGERDPQLSPAPARLNDGHHKSQGALSRNGTNIFCSWLEFEVDQK